MHRFVAPEKPGSSQGATHSCQAMIFGSGVGTGPVGAVGMWLASAVESGFRWCKPVDGVVLKFEFVIPLMGGIGLNLLSAVVIAYTERGGVGTAVGTRHISVYFGSTFWVNFMYKRTTGPRETCLPTTCAYVRTACSLLAEASIRTATDVRLTATDVRSSPPPSKNGTGHPVFDRVCVREPHDSP